MLQLHSILPFWRVFLRCVFGIIYGFPSFFPFLFSAQPRHTRVLVADGLIGLLAISTSGDEITCLVENDSVLGENKNVNIPGEIVDLPAVTEKDIVRRYILHNAVFIIRFSSSHPSLGAAMIGVCRFWCKERDGFHRRLVHPQGPRYPRHP
jgi:hypothetical protein